jgi:hypothetical protein
MPSEQGRTGPLGNSREIGVSASEGSLDLGSRFVEDRRGLGDPHRVNDDEAKGQPLFDTQPVEDTVRIEESFTVSPCTSGGDLAPAKKPIPQPFDSQLPARRANQASE